MSWKKSLPEVIVEIIPSTKLRKLFNEIHDSKNDILDVLDQVSFYWDYVTDEMTPYESAQIGYKLGTKVGPVFSATIPNSDATVLMLGHENDLIANINAILEVALEE